MKSQTISQTEQILSCSKIQENGLLVDYIAGTDIHLDKHLASCATCAQEYQWLLQFQQHSRAVADECQTVMDTIDWEANAMQISQHIPYKSPVALVAKGFVFSWSRAAAAIFLVFAIGLGFGYLLFHTPAPLQKAILSHQDSSPHFTLARLETSMARRDVTTFFQQTQLVLNDLLQYCDTQQTFSWKDQLDMKRVHILLQKCRYFNQDLNNPDLLSSRDLLQKVQWLLSEILMNDTDDSCLKLQQLQDYVRQERLLFKIHLVTKELSLSEV